MEFLKVQAKNIGEQLQGMSFSQRAAIALLLVVLLGGMWGIIKWGSERQWADLLNRSLTVEEIQGVQTQLQLAGATTKVQGDRVMVHGDESEMYRLKAVLAQGNIQIGSSLGFEALFNDDNVFDSDQKQGWKQLRTLETELSKVIGGFSYIQTGQVFIEVPKRRGFGSRSAASRASVHVSMHGGGRLTKARIAAIANFVCGAVRGLEPQNVKITDGEKSYSPANVADAMSSDLLDRQREHEDRYAQKIYDQLRYIPGVLVNVHAVMRTVDEQSQKTAYGKARVDEEETESQEETGASGAAGPGVRPNQGRALADAGSGQSSTKEKTRTSFKGPIDQESTITKKPMGYVERLTASVNVPRSYLARVLQAQKPDLTEVTEGDLQPIAAAELPKIRDLVKPLIDAKTEEQVVVQMYYDVAPEAEGGIPESQTAGFPGFIEMAKDYGPQAGLGLLAVFSLFMVLRIAKKAQATVALPGPKGVAAAMGGGGMAGGEYGGASAFDPIDTGPYTVGEAQELDGVLIGQEVDEGTVRTSQLVDQINDMVKEDPASATSIVDHWLHDEQ